MTACQSVTPASLGRLWPPRTATMCMSSDGEHLGRASAKAADHSQNSKISAPGPSTVPFLTGDLMGRESRVTNSPRRFGRPGRDLFTVARVVKNALHPKGTSCVTE